MQKEHNTVSMAKTRRDEARSFSGKNGYECESFDKWKADAAKVVEYSKESWKADTGDHVGKIAARNGPLRLWPCS